MYSDTGTSLTRIPRRDLLAGYRPCQPRPARPSGGERAYLDCGFFASRYQSDTVEEQLRGWLAVLRAAKHGDMRCAAYARLRAAVEYFASSTLLDYDRAADDHFENLRRQGIRIGTQDLRIAAIALTRNAIVVTRNAHDFSLVPGLKTEDWSLPAS